MTGQLTFTEARIESAEGTMLAALVWIQENPSAWDTIVGGAQRDALDGVPVRLKLYVEELRGDHSLTPSTDERRIANGLTAALGRILKSWHPEVAPYVRLRPSKLDGIVIPPRSHQ